MQMIFLEKNNMYFNVSFTQTRKQSHTKTAVWGPEKRERCPSSPKPRRWPCVSPPRASGFAGTFSPDVDP